MDSSFRAFLVKKLVKSVYYDTTNLQVRASDIALGGRSDRIAVYGEGQIHGYSKTEVDQFISEVIETGISFSPSEEEKSRINPVELAVGQHIKIEHAKGHSSYVEELLKIDAKHFLLIDHDRGALTPGTILTVKSTPWFVGDKIEWLFEDETKEYHSEKVVKILLLTPSSNYEYLNPGYQMKPKRYFTGAAAENRQFLFSSLSHKQTQESLFVIEREDENKAAFYPIQGLNYDQQMADELKVVCQIKKSFDPDKSNLKILQKGELERQDMSWSLLRLAVIEFN